MWGDEPEQPGERLANFWHGDFPWRNEPGYGATTPVGSFPRQRVRPARHGRQRWEWTSDWYGTRLPAAAVLRPAATEEGSLDPAQPQFRVPRKVVKGGSFLCADSYCQRYRPAARRPQMIDTGMSHVGFRCVTRRVGTTPAGSA